jgi:RNA polymerase sigma-70 factor (ECF subfamily)
MIIEDKVLKDLEISEILQIIDTLPWEQAQAIKLKYMEQLTLQEIADRFNTQPKTIKSRIHDGMVKLRKSFNKGGSYNGL